MEFPIIPPTPLPTPPKKAEIPQLEIVDTATRAAANIKQTAGSKLSQEELADLLVMLSEGVTYESIIRRFRWRWKRGISTKTIKKYLDKYAGRIDDVAKDIHKLAIETGLSKKSNRLRRLQQLAEAQEERLFNEEGSLGDGVRGKDITAYQDTLKLLGIESGDIKVESQGDIIFTNLSNEELKKLAAGKLAANKDFAVELAEKAGVRPQAPIEKEDKRAKEKANTENANEGKDANERNARRNAANADGYERAMAESIETVKG